MKKTKLMSIVLAAVLLLGLAVPAMAADEEFEIRNGMLLKYHGDGGDVVIPDGVTGVGIFAFNLCRNVTSVTFPDGFDYIGKYAFSECTGLESINIPEGVTLIDEGAFHNCDKLESITIPSSVNKIVMGAFSDCDSLQSVTISEGVTIIDRDVFALCISLESVKIPSSVTEIGQSAFTSCLNLKSVEIGDGVKSIGMYAFSDCPNLTDVTIPEGVTDIGEGVFATCKSLSKIALPASITKIGLGAFSKYSMTDIYYAGSKEQWENIDVFYIGVGGPFDGINIHYNSSTIPSTTPEPEKPTPEPAAISFTDVPASAYYADAVKWAVDKGITNGTGANTFSPDTTCNTAQILTFLWRACGSPKANAANSFTDVAGNAYYYDAAQWAKAQGMVSGSTLSPDTPCTRASTVMFIWQAAGRPGAGSAAAFTDVPANANYAAAVAWAVESGVTTGTGADTFSPDATCTRGQIVTFLYRAAAVK